MGVGGFLWVVVIMFMKISNVKINLVIEQKQT